ncbi:MAG TPA: tetratricopeptide repeat protein [Myxococcales bacterium LLY-WYZ-16_1]|nr:tetratricopeptide repeat protein [Myxococcales bacterium LLY-WYZ-16_1]
MSDSPLMKLSRDLVARDPAELVADSPQTAVSRWARGEQTLQELKGYSAEEVYAISQQGYSLFLNGKVRDAQVVFEGLVALDPRNDYHYRALGVIYHRLGDVERALRQFTHAITVAPRNPAGYVNRAEVHIARRDMGRALADLEKAVRAAPSGDDPVARKAHALRRLLNGVV